MCAICAFLLVAMFDGPGNSGRVGCILYVILQPVVRLYRNCLFNTLGSHVKPIKSGFDASARYGGGVKDFTRLAIG
jgi:hypothetical protein